MYELKYSSYPYTRSFLKNAFMGSDLLYINILRFIHHSEIFHILWRMKCRPVKNETQTCEEMNADWSVFTAYLNSSDTQKRVLHTIQGC